MSMAYFILRFQSYLAAFFDQSMRALGPLLVALGFGLVGLITYFYFMTPIIPAHQSLVVKVMYTLPGLWLLFNILFNWFMCMMTPAGAPPDKSEVDLETGTLLRGRYTTGAVDSPHTDLPTCRRCKGFKPPRTHHCHVCGSCVLKMDHHCPWMNNCVGHFNYRYFVLFLIYMWLGCWFVVITVFSFWPVSGMFSPAAHTRVPEGVNFSFLLTVSVGIAVGILLFWHLYLVLSNQTTIEFYQNRTRASLFRHRGETFVNEFDLGWRRNWESVFGHHRFLLAGLLPSMAPPPGNGVTYPSYKSMVLEKYSDDRSV